MKRILFVCTGNTCRSPLAEHLLRAKYPDRYEVKSAGIAAFDGEDAASHVHQVLQEKGISIKHRSQSVTLELIQWADIVLTMTENHQHILSENFRLEAGKIVALKHYVSGASTGGDIADPYGGSEEQYRKTMAELDALIEQLMERERK